MEKILVPCDFSVQAEEAFCSAVSIAQHSGGEVHLLHVLELPVVNDPVIMPVVGFEEGLIGELKMKAEVAFASMLTKFPPKNTRVYPHFLTGPIAKIILDFIEGENMDLVVMGTNGASGIKELVTGSNTEKIVRFSPVPVLAIRKRIEAKKVHHIVFPTSLNLQREDLVQHVKALQAFFHATLHVVWINTPTNFTRDIYTLQELKDFANRFMLRDYTLNIFNDNNEESGIIAFAKHIDADLIAMGTHGRKGLAHVLNGSVAEDVVNHVESPIWTYKMK